MFGEHCLRDDEQSKSPIGVQFFRNAPVDNAVAYAA
jgi:hypothetical protein